MKAPARLGSVQTSRPLIAVAFFVASLAYAIVSLTAPPNSGQRPFGAAITAILDIL